MPSSLLAAGVPLEFRLTLDVTPTDMSRPSNSGRYTQFHRYDQTSTGGWSLLSFILPDLISSGFPRSCWRFYAGLYVNPRFFAVPMPEMGDSLWFARLTMISTLAYLSNHGSRWLPLRCSRKSLEHPTRLSGLQGRAPTHCREAISGSLTI